MILIYMHPQSTQSKLIDIPKEQKEQIEQKLTSFGYIFVICDNVGDALEQFVGKLGELSILAPITN